MEEYTFNDFIKIPFSDRDYLEKQLLQLMPLLRGTSCHVEIVELEAKITRITKELEALSDR